MTPKQQNSRTKGNYSDVQAADSSRIDQDPDDLRAAYNAIVDYHNSLVNIRFTVAALLLAANSFLIGSWYDCANGPHGSYFIPTLGLLIALACIGLEMRTFQLLENLDARGRRIEGDLRLSAERGFFALMGNQPIPLRLPVFRCIKLPFLRFVVAHSTGLYFLYLFLLVFWVLVLASPYYPGVLAALGWTSMCPK